MVRSLYLVERTDKVTWDEYDSFVVCAESEDEARRVHPSGKLFFKDGTSEESRKVGNISNRLGQIRLKPWK